MRPRQPTKLVPLAWGVGAQQASLETWQPGSSQFSLWWMAFFQKYNPLQLCRPILFCHASQIDRSSPARRMQDTRGSMSYCSQIVYSQAAQVIVIATNHSHS